MQFLRFRSVLLVAAAAIGAACGTGHATIVPFTEDFDNGPSNWFDAPGTGLLDWVASGGPDGGAYVTTLFMVPDPLPPFGSTLFRGQDEFGSSGGAFEGDWLADGVSEFSFWIRHDAPVAVDAFVRFASPANFPGAVGLAPGPIAPNTWTEITVAIDEANPLLILEGVSFRETFSNIGHIQIGLIASGDLIGQTLTVDLDKVSVVPAPGGLALLLLGAWGRRRRRAVASAALLAAGAAAIPAGAQPVEVVFDEPTLDRWMYPFNQSPGSREFASIFGALTPEGFLDEFDNRDGQMIIGFDTAAFVETGLGPTGYTVTSATVTLMVIDDETFGYDPTPDPYTSWLDAGDPEFAPDPDAGRPVELFGAGFRCGFTALTFPENGPYCDSCNCLKGCKGERCVYPIDFGASCDARDVSNNVDARFDPVPWAVASNPALAQGQPVPADAELTFVIDVCDPCIRSYLAESLDVGVLDLVVASIFPAQQQQAGTFPKLYTNDNLLVQLGLASAARLEMTVVLGPPGDLDGDGQVSTSDLLALLGAWGPCPAPPESCPADIDCNGIVATGDLLTLLGNWG